MHNSDRNRESVCDYACQRERVILTRGVICDMMKLLSPVSHKKNLWIIMKPLESFGFQGAILL